MAGMARSSARGTWRTRTRTRRSRGRRGPARSRMTGIRNWRAMRDMRRYRHNYPDLVERDYNGDMPNLSFYRNEIRFLPNGCFIEDILQNWRDNYDVLEDNHSYIQWLFPLREPGVNWHAKPLTLQEVEAFKSSQEIQERLIRAYKLMLGFYGIQLVDQDTGTVCRAQNYQERFQNLNWHGHNNLRITRILKSLGELGLQHYQAPLARFFLEETLVRRELPGVRQSALDYFVFAVRCRRQRRQLVHFAWEHFRPRCKFVWGPHDKLQKFRPSSPPQPDPGQAEGLQNPGEPPHEASSRTCGTGWDEDPVTEGPQLPSVESQDTGTLERSPGEEAEGHREDGLEPMSPKEGKKRKLELSRRELGSPSAAEVEKIVLNLEGCGLGAGTPEVGSQDSGKAEQPGLPAQGSRAADEARKRRRVDQATRDSVVAASEGTQMPAPPKCPEAGKGESRVQEDMEGQVGPEQGVPGSPVPAGPPGDEREPEVAGSGPSAKPAEP
ncbi:opioid growth factor receptor isoform X2 [Carlito syrichta]|uniref:Opioid growth factor receptor isoform X2 n=1 Tax=Carlito syrichta TaxID=1868482 RepID=A0A1U7TZI5_CARSF|nr:opioid growth factor receptor isoform X2 [Carlito syrichta]